VVSRPAVDVAADEVRVPLLEGDRTEHTPRLDRRRGSGGEPFDLGLDPFGYVGQRAEGDVAVGPGRVSARRRPRRVRGWAGQGGRTAARATRRARRPPPRRRSRRGSRRGRPYRPGHTRRPATGSAPPGPNPSSKRRVRSGSSRAAAPYPRGGHGPATRITWRGIRSSRTARRGQLFEGADAPAGLELAPRGAKRSNQGVGQSLRAFTEPRPPSPRRYARRPRAPRSLAGSVARIPGSPGRRSRAP
jgi:hypothetical protein